MAASPAVINKSNPSLCIPRVFPNITWRRVKDVFEDLGLGIIDRVDMVNKTNDAGQKFKRVFVHFKKWDTNPDAQAVKDKILSGDFVKIIYDEPWFWKVFMSKAPKPKFDKKPHDKKPQGKKPSKTTPRLATDGHPGNPTPAKASRELEELKKMMRAQMEEMEQLKAQLEQAKHGVGDTTPTYTPASPAYSPASQDDALAPPPLERETAVTAE